MAITDNLISFWELDEASGTRADAHGANHLTDNNTVGSASGAVGQAASFYNPGAQNEYLSLPDGPSLRTGDIDFSFACWIRARDLQGIRTVLSKFNYVASTREYILYANGTTLAWVASTDGLDEVAVSLAGLEIERWYFVVCWHDAAGDKLYLQVDDGAVLETTLAVGSTGTSQFHVGGIDGTIDYRWYGEIDGLGFWKRVLTPAERTWLYNEGTGRSYAALSGTPGFTGSAAAPVLGLQALDATGLPGGVAAVSVAASVIWSGIAAQGVAGVNPTFGLASFWEMEEAGGTRLDAHGTNHLADTNTVGQSPGRVGAGAQFDYGQSEYLSIAGGEQSALDPGAGSFSVAAWIMPATLSPDYGMVVHKGAGSIAEAGYNLHVTPAGSVSAEISDGVTRIVCDTGGGVAVETWVFVVFVLDRSAGALILYLDAVPQASEFLPSMVDVAGTADFAVGARPEQASTQAFGGVIDQVAVWGRALSPAEVTWLFNGAAGRSYADVAATGPLLATASASSYALTGEAATMAPRPRATAVEVALEPLASIRLEITPLHWIELTLAEAA